MAGTPYSDIIDRHYPEDSPLRDIYLRHARQVADEALEICRRKGLELDPERVEAAAMLHDIGIFLTDAPGICCHGAAPYIEHGPLGAALLRAEGAPEWAARVAERHTGSGIPPYVPETQLERLICYADKFYSKSGSMERKSPGRVEAAMARYGEDSLSRYRRLRDEFA